MSSKGPEPSAHVRFKYLNTFSGDTAAADQDYFYHHTEGPWLFPYDWLLAMEQSSKQYQDSNVPCNDMQLFTEPAYLASFGLLLGPDDLPVGLLRSPEPRFIPKYHPLTGLNNLHWVGATCAFCHTGELHYKNQRFRVHGSQAMLDSLRFQKEMGEALKDTVQNRTKFACFEDRVNPDRKNNNEEQQKKDSEALLKRILAFLFYGGTINPEAKEKQSYPSLWGFGRIDAYGRGGNTLLSALVDNEPQVPFGHGDNRMVANASVSMPHIWWAWDYLWVQWNGSIMQPLARNIAAVTTAGRRLSFGSKAAYQSDVDIAILSQLEDRSRKITPPRWPEEFGGLNESAALAGKKLYGDLCVHCHVPQQVVKMKGYQFYNLTMVPLEEIGTDENHAKNFHDRVVTTGRLEPLLAKKQMPAVDFMQLYSEEVRRQQLELMKRNYQLEKKQPFPAEEEDRVNGYRDNAWRSQVCTVEGDKQVCKLAYMARPHVGIWATPPFLHNGSVPSIYMLLSPEVDRDREAGCFYMNPFLEYDPDHLGYPVKSCKDNPPKEGVPDSFYDKNGFKFDTTLSGNHNTGHEFKGDGKGGKGNIGRGLAHDERMQVIEYLKSCDLEQVRSKDDWERIKTAPLQRCS